MIHILPFITACTLFTSILIAGCGGGGGGSGSVVEDIHQEASPANAGLVVKSVRDMGVIRTNPTILKRDCGFSSLYEGRSVWLFGDTLMEFPSADDTRMISNSLSATYDIDAGDGIEGFSEHVDAVGAPLPFFPLTEEEKAFNRRYVSRNCEEEQCTANWHIWPGTIIVDDEKGWAYIFYRKVLVESGLFNFAHVGHSLAVWENFSEPPRRPVFNYVESYPTLFFSEEGEHGFGTAAVVVDRVAYVYGCEMEEDTLAKPCRLARVPLASILDKSAWRYYSGNGHWSSDGLESQVIFNGNDMMSVFYNAYIDRFVVVYSAPLGATAMLRTAVHPEGPWSAPVEIITVDAPENAYGWVYDFLAHPEFSQDNGRTIYISYSKNIDQRHSQTRLIAVELEVYQ